MANFNDFLEAINPNEFEEDPVDIDTFLYDKEYMGNYTEGIVLSPIQKDIVDRGSQIYYHETLIKKFGRERGEELWTKTVKELLLMLGKGSGKDFVARLTVLYIVYKLLCLKDPARYYRKPGGDPIDIINMALNAPQAKTVFYEPLVAAVKKSPWFAGKFDDLSTQINFDKNITVYSMHSSFEAAEGKNILVAVLDEIDGFTVEGQAEKIYRAVSGTLSSRFPGIGKMLTLSFPRTKNGFMMKTYDEIVKTKEVNNFSHEFILNESLDADEPGNMFTVSWTEDTIIDYERDNIYALKAPTFRVNPERNIEDYRDDFDRDRKNHDDDTLMRVCANPPDHDETSFISNHDQIEKTFDQPNGWQDDIIKTIPVADAEYYIHVDLSKVSDRTCVAIGHVSSWVEPDQFARIHTEPMPFIVIDAFRVWEPTKLKPVDDGEVMEFIMSLCKKFNVRLVTFDQWHSFDNIKYLESVGVDSEKHSLNREDYLEFRTAMMENRMSGPYDERLHKELKNLIIVKGKVVEPQGKEHYNDISEACCGVTVNCITHTQRNTELELVTLESIARDDYEELQNADPFATVVGEKPDMPGYLSDFMNGWKAI